MNSATFLFFLLVISFVRSEIPFSTSMGNPRNYPFGLLRRHKITKMQPKDLVDECRDCQPFPTPADLDVSRLTKLIGGTLDYNLVSIIKPTNFSSSTQDTLHTKTEALRDLIINSTKEMKINGGTLSKDQQQFLVSWLQVFSSCSLRKVWKDMGPFSWPRYIKRAYCESKRCSLVPTMQCLPSSRRFFPVLRWYCLSAASASLYPQSVRKNLTKRNGFLCRWIRYNQPITTGCSCGCQS
ncbi:noggin-2-like [Actinia tenebrosa]|uniref:Noggin-2-like n=1 Tax=Actinia tenebrosa TaxID=6105 RepID=A0A6P8IRJ8_ACTTE|nr:noggin-2-like [Actinia tenebrosa]